MRLFKSSVRAIAFVSMVLTASVAAADSKNGLCVTDIHLQLSPKLGVYKYNSANSGQSYGGVDLEVPVMQWDVPLAQDSNGGIARTIMGMSYKLAPFSEGECLDSVAIKQHVRGQAPYPTSNRVPWTARGHWYTQNVQGIVIPSTRDLDPRDKESYDNPANDPGGQGVLTATLFTRKMTQGIDHSDWIVTGVAIQPYRECQPPIGAFCVGRWNDQQYQPRRLIVYMEPYSAFLKTAVSVVTGQWVELSNCNGCSDTNFQYVTGVTSGKSFGSTSETSRSISLTVGLSAEVNVPFGKVQPKVEWTGTMSESQARSIASSFESQQSSTFTQSCARGRLFQWETTAAIEDGSRSTARAKLFVCTGNDDYPANPRDISWVGCDAEEVFPQVNVDGGAKPGIRYTSTGSWWQCKKKGISVVSATYGGNCGVAKGNVTRQLADSCNGQTFCAYTINYQALGGDPAVGCAKDYAAEYKCIGGPALSRTVSVKGEAGLGSSVTLSCQ